MAERGRGGYHGGGGGGDHRPQQGDRQHQNRPNQGQNKSKQTLFDLSHLINKNIRVKLIGGREVVGSLKGYDQLQNMVLDEVSEFIKSYDDSSVVTTRRLGLVVVRGPSVMAISPGEGFEEIPNPFLAEGQPE